MILQFFFSYLRSLRFFENENCAGCAKICRFFLFDPLKIYLISRNVRSFLRKSQKVLNHSTLLYSVHDSLFSPLISYRWNRWFKTSFFIDDNNIDSTLYLWILTTLTHAVVYTVCITSVKTWLHQQDYHSPYRYNK